MKLEVGQEYLTKSGNVVRCVAKVDKRTICRYTKVIEGHESLMEEAQNWRENGEWLQYPGGIHDIVEALN